MKAISKRMGVSEGWLSDTLKDGSNPKISYFIRLAQAIGYPPGKLLDAEGRIALEVPVEGIVSGGEGWSPVDDGVHEPAVFDLTPDDIVAFEVRGDSMSPVFRDGDMLFCSRRPAAYAHNLIGSDCVVRTEGGENYVKILAKGSRPGLFNLKSYKPHVEDIEDVSLLWAAPVVWIRRGR